MQSSVNGFGLMRSHCGAELRPVFSSAQLSLDAVKMIDLAQEPSGHEWVLFTGLMELAPNVRLMWSST